MTRPDLLMTGTMMPMIMDQLDAAFTVHRIWEADDKDAMLAAIGDKIVTIATGGGHMPVDATLMKRLPNLRIISNFGVGYDTVDAAWAGQNGIVVTHTPDVLTEEVADTAIALMLMTAREFPASERYLRAGKWLDNPYPLTPKTLRDRTLGIFGLGRIGKAIAKRAEAFGMAIEYHNRSKADDVPYPYHDTLSGLAQAVDTLMIVVPGGDATFHAVNAEVLKALGPDGLLINIGRGTTVDEPALIKALQDGTIWSAGLDVFEEEPSVPQALIDMERVVLLPHVGSASIHTRNGMGQLVVDNLLRWKEGKPPITPVPETPVNS